MTLIQDYIDWTATVWSGSQQGEPQTRDIAVMGLGLPGESGEVLEALMPQIEGSASSLDRNNLLKELGDTIYYWARICRAFDIPAELVWGPQEEPPPLLEGTPILLLRLAMGSARVAEHLKKYIRDNNCNRETLAQALAQTAKSWRDLCVDQEFSLEEVLATNKKKIEGRLERGTLRGSGNDR